MTDQQLAEQVLHACRAKGWMVATAESCTGGLIAGMLTAVAGSSDVVDRGFITYSNQAKAEMLGVSADLLTTHGAVSELVARAMAEGALARSAAHLALSVTGIAGPGGGTAEKPVGLVHMACARRDGDTHHKALHFHGNRDRVRAATVTEALTTILRLATDQS
ncbi:CinA family protein [Magnetospira sp. QH-2]|uniref:CinA family protein n=1 Tax=Magnetospira sp. (strain QH-2) TaxID=1288970 RepID=UPI0003E811A7|nr:nicotinamide-nucleotide amidohydrolase family protein [Magnetospira sp. QH-2]CCQ73469.1 Conserved protein of unknown function [Magnetospira sp. QH-2]